MRVWIFGRNFSSSDVLQIHIVFISLAFGTCIELPWRLQHRFAVYAAILFEHYFEVQIISEFVKWQEWSHAIGITDKLRISLHI